MDRRLVHDKYTTNFLCSSTTKPTPPDRHREPSAFMGIDPAPPPQHPLAMVQFSQGGSRAGRRSRGRRASRRAPWRWTEALIDLKSELPRWHPSCARA
uniref:Uncharacterized protein n=1 Tax=Setaria viridis TaxID=4556 RepID=A0A4U6TVT8_SETVI|nr:hypothetical protein SEVIR_7G274150v2 [Setaria viridis]